MVDLFAVVVLIVNTAYVPVVKRGNTRFIDAVSTDIKVGNSVNIINYI